MAKHSSRRASRSRGSRRSRPSAPPMTQPAAMKTKHYVYGVEPVNGHDAWALFVACAAGDLSQGRSLIAKDERLVNAQCWYQFPIHMAVRQGHARIVELLLEHGADPGQSRFTCDSWDKLLRVAREREHTDVEKLLEGVLKRRFNYSPEFAKLRNAIIARDTRKISGVLRSASKLARASDALGNNPLHWSVITRQQKLIERFAKLGTPMEAQRADGQTPLLLAANETYDYWYRGARSRGHPSIRNAWVLVGDLLARGAKYTISVAAAVGDREHIEYLLKKDDTLARQLDSSRVSPLSHAAREGYTHIVRLLLEHGADPNLPEDLAPNGRALFEACGGNHLETAELLLEHGANPNAGVDSCGCCLTICEHHHGKQSKPLRRLLRRYGAYDPPYVMNAKQMKRAIRDRHEVTRDEEFLARVMDQRDAELLDLYLDSRPEVVQDMHAYAGITYPDSPELVRKLLARGLDPNKRDWLGKTFLHACAAKLDRTNAEVFLEAGADIHARDVEFQETPLTTTIRCDPRCQEADRPKLEKRRRKMVEFLLKRGAAPNLPDDQPWSTPLAWAQRRDLSEIEKLLQNHEANA